MFAKTMLQKACLLRERKLLFFISVSKVSETKKKKKETISNGHLFSTVVEAHRAAGYKLRKPDWVQWVVLTMVVGPSLPGAFDN